LVEEVHWLQDWALEEDRTSLEILERLHGGQAFELQEGQEVKGDGSLEEAEDDLTEVDGNFVEVELEPTVFTMGPPGPSTTRQAVRRRRLRRERPPVLSKKDSLTRGRVQKASRLSLSTNAEVSRLKPGLKFKEGDVKVYTLEELKEEGFKVVSWDGK
jgi:hypothetical protein